MTEAQQAVIRKQAMKREAARAEYEKEDGILTAMLIMHDARFAEPDSGLEFNLNTMSVVEPPKDGG